MAKNDFFGESAENYEQKCLCVFVLDISGSMNEIVDNTNVIDTGRQVFVDGKTYNIVEGGISKLDNLNEGLRNFYDEISNNSTTSQRLEISIITFNDQVKCIQSPSLIANMNMPTLCADGDTALVDAMNEAIDLVTDRKNWYKSTNQTYYRPWIILITDGEPNQGQDVETLAARIKKDCNDKRYAFLPIGVDNANMGVLQKLQGNLPAMKLKGTKFGAFFNWLSASMGTVVTAEEGQVDLHNGMDDWMEKMFTEVK